MQKVAEAAAQGAGRYEIMRCGPLNRCNRMIKEAAAQREAGKTLRIEGKGGVDLVTETDQACEKFIIQTIRVGNKLIIGGFTWQGCLSGPLLRR